MVFKQIKLEQPNTDKQDIYKFLSDKSIKVLLERIECGDQVTLILPIRSSFLIQDGSSDSLIGVLVEKAEKDLFQFAEMKIEQMSDVSGEIDYAATHTSVWMNLIKLAEEAAELTAICAKAVFTLKPDYRAIAGEMADVDICIKILKRQIPLIPSVYKTTYNEKIQRMELKRKNADKSDAEQKFVVSLGHVIPENEGL